MSAPCSWTLNPLCSIWADLTAKEQERATNYATTILWASTGRRFGLCPQRVRPCGRRTNGSSMWGYIQGEGGGWYPFLDAAGTWRNCSCGMGGCACGPRCEVWLPGPVERVLEVRQDGLVVDPTSYQVDNGRWLVRTDGGCWPEHADLSTNIDRFEVLYVRGTPVPQVLEDAAGILACEFAKAFKEQDCRLPARLSTLSRQGVQMTALDRDSLTRSNFTGIPEVDQVIFALNPHGLYSRPKVMSPDWQAPRIRRAS